MSYSKIKELLKKETLWVVMDIGWYYSLPLSVHFTEEQAIQEWEKVVNEKYTEENYQKHTQIKNTQNEGHWYYEIKKVPMKDVLDTMEKNIIDWTIDREAEKIQETAMRNASYEVRKQTKKQMQEVINGMLYYLDENGFDTYITSYDKKKNNFWEKIKNCRK
jgi:hypothetical protein